MDGGRLGLIGFVFLLAVTGILLRDAFYRSTWSHNPMTVGVTYQLSHPKCGERTVKVTQIAPGNGSLNTARVSTDGAAEAAVEQGESIPGNEFNCLLAYYGEITLTSDTEGITGTVDLRLPPEATLRPQ